MTSAILLYLLAAAILWLFRSRTRGLSFAGLLDRSAEEHHQVQRVITKHPHGGTWQEYQQ